MLGKDLKQQELSYTADTAYEIGTTILESCLAVSVLSLMSIQQVHT